ncbi:hypothetical protein VitviT2T_025343 [Vitis vinifera]|uniref:Protein kinase domain-containing protein n=1 Tax=Vitis vinifera TaxID=29760 RepID=A0ABY9DKY4_VITVI|nr:hypothetical protein VitviT2T_025343 [Vitis vinifera]
MVSRCSDQGPAIRFPFRLKDQPENCGYPGFELSCTETNQTILDMPSSVKLSVKNIKYKSREIVVEDPNNCLQSQLQNLRLSASPFHFKLNHSFELQAFTFFNCSANRSDSSYFKSIKSFSKSCSFLPGNPLYAVDSSTSLTDLDVSSCRRIYNLSLPTYYIYEGENRLYLKWEESICGNCEAEGKKCRLKKSNGKKPETECITDTKVSQDECMASSKCSDQGPAIRFPFQLKDRHPHHCGCPLFELSCTEKNQTMLELPHSVKFLVKNINYKSQQILVHDPDYCLPRQLGNLDLAATPFKFSEELENSTFFICSSVNGQTFGERVPCLDVPGYQVWKFPSSEVMSFPELLPCGNKMYASSLPKDEYGEIKNNFHLNWTTPSHCKGKGALIKPLIVTGVIVGFPLLMSIIIALYKVYDSNKMGREYKIRIEKFLEDYRALKPSRYTYIDIKKITNQFKDKLGEGGYGIVYKGKLSNEVLVAVKILNNSKGNGEEFINEVGTMGRIHHVNVVRLVGFCAEGSKRALIYEFQPNESLEKFIFSEAVKNHSLGWKKLQGIAVGIAKGIEYLHQAKVCSKEQSRVSMTTARGTMGYIAPEVLSRNFGSVSYKSDVYSFGMLLLEMVGGRKNIDVSVENASQVYFPEWVYNHLNQGEEIHIRIEEERDFEIAKKLTIVGLWCIQWCPINRPSMKDVVQMLEEERNNVTIPPNPFAFTGPTRTNIKSLQRPLQELTVISELE